MIVATQPALLGIVGLAKHYGMGADRVEALKGIDLEIHKGEFVVFMGSSGSGKSTLLHLLAGLDEPTSGQIFLGDTDLSKLNDDARTLIRRDKIGVILQSFQLLESLTAEENVSLPLIIAGRPPTEARRLAGLHLDQVGLLHRRKHRPQEMSGGEQQRVAIARALIIRPLILLADEPTGNLDSTNGLAIIRLLRQLVDDHQHTLLMVTHDPLPATMADRVIHLRDGRIVEHS